MQVVGIAIRGLRRLGLVDPLFVLALELLAVLAVQVEDDREHDEPDADVHRPAIGLALGLRNLHRWERWALAALDQRRPTQRGALGGRRSGGGWRLGRQLDELERNALVER